jgi:hypothetical protein
MSKFYLFAENAELLVVSTTRKPVIQLLHYIGNVNDTWSSADVVDCSRMDSSLVWNLEIRFLHAAARSKHASSKCNLCLVNVGLFATTCNPTLRRGVAWTVFRILYVMCFFLSPAWQFLRIYRCKTSLIQKFLLSRIIATSFLIFPVPIRAECEVWRFFPYD